MPSIFLTSNFKIFFCKILIFPFFLFYFYLFILYTLLKAYPMHPTVPWPPISTNESMCQVHKVGSGLKSRRKISPVREVKRMIRKWKIYKLVAGKSAIDNILWRKFTLKILGFFIAFLLQWFHNQVEIVVRFLKELIHLNRNRSEIYWFNELKNAYLVVIYIIYC